MKKRQHNNKLNTRQVSQLNRKLASLHLWVLFSHFYIICCWRECFFQLFSATIFILLFILQILHNFFEFCLFFLTKHNTGKNLAQCQTYKISATPRKMIEISQFFYISHWASSVMKTKWIVFLRLKIYKRYNSIKLNAYGFVHWNWIDSIHTPSVVNEGLFNRWIDFAIYHTKYSFNDAENITTDTSILLLLLGFSLIQ